MTRWVQLGKSASPSRMCFAPASAIFRSTSRSSLLCFGIRRISISDYRTYPFSGQSLTDSSDSKQSFFAWAGASGEERRRNLPRDAAPQRALADEVPALHREEFSLSGNR